MGNLSLIQKIIVYAIPLLFAITVHEVAHGWVAEKLGDKTARMMGRITLNPIKHIDPMGTILVPAVLLLMGGFIFGWAKPVPITWQNLKNPKRDMALVALAGPGANFIMALLWGLIAFIGATINTPMTIALVLMGHAGIVINLVLMVLNLLPIPPLDGSRILSAWLPNKWSWQYSRIEPYGFFILVGLLATGILSKILAPPVIGLYGIIASLFGLS